MISLGRMGSRETVVVRGAAGGKSRRKPRGGVVRVDRVRIGPPVAVVTMCRRVQRRRRAESFTVHNFEATVAQNVGGRSRQFDLSRRRMGDTSVCVCARVCDRVEHGRQ
jgi:hypothetical protein